MDRRLELTSEMSPFIWVHLVAMLIALFVGGAVVFARKGTARHRLLGRIWVAMMVIASLSSFWIFEIVDGGFSPIHGLSLWTLFAVTMGVLAIRRTPPAIQTHKQFMQSLYAGGILIAGGFTYLPERLLGRLTFGERLPLLNYVIVAALVATGAVLMWKTFRPTQRLKEMDGSNEPQY